jgi:hypothetical protein
MRHPRGGRRCAVPPAAATWPGGVPRVLGTSRAREVPSGGRGSGCQRGRDPVAGRGDRGDAPARQVHGRRRRVRDLSADQEVGSGAAFPDRITIGRTPNNDVVINDTSISRLHAYVKRASDQWIVADAGSKNGSSLRGAPLEARREQPLPSRAQLKLSDVDLTFYLAADLYAALGGTT